MVILIQVDHCGISPALYLLEVEAVKSVSMKLCYPLKKKKKKVSKHVKA